MKTPTDEQLKKLPKWAQDHISELNIKLNALERSNDQQTPSSIYSEDLVTGTKSFIQSRHVVVNHSGIRLMVSCDNDGIDFLWLRENHRIQDIGIFPSASNSIKLKGF